MNESEWGLCASCVHKGEGCAHNYAGPIVFCHRYSDGESLWVSDEKLEK